MLTSLPLPPTPSSQELEANSRLLAELTLSVQCEERGRAAAEDQTAALRGHLQGLEQELRVAQVEGSEGGGEAGQRWPS